MPVRLRRGANGEVAEGVAGVLAARVEGEPTPFKPARASRVAQDHPRRGLGLAAVPGPAIDEWLADLVTRRYAVGETYEWRGATHTVVEVLFENVVVVDGPHPSADHPLSHMSDDELLRFAEKAWAREAVRSRTGRLLPVDVDDETLDDILRRLGLHWGDD